MIDFCDSACACTADRRHAGLAVGHYLFRSTRTRESVASAAAAESTVQWVTANVRVSHSPPPSASALPPMTTMIKFAPSVCVMDGWMDGNSSSRVTDGPRPTTHYIHNVAPRSWAHGTPGWLAARPVERTAVPHSIGTSMNHLTTNVMGNEKTTPRNARDRRRRSKRNLSSNCTHRMRMRQVRIC